MSNDHQKSATFSVDDQNSMRSGSKLTESEYVDDFESVSMSKSHVSASRGGGSKGNANRLSHLS